MYDHTFYLQQFSWTFLESINSQSQEISANLLISKEIPIAYSALCEKSY